MIVGVAVVELRIHASQSLNEKRGVVRKLVGRLRHRFNVSVSEVGGQETWQRAVIGLAMAGHDETVVRKTLRRAVDFVDETHLAEILASDFELMKMPLELAPFSQADGDEDEGGEDEGGADGDDDENDDWDLPWSGAGRGGQGTGEG